MTFLSIFLDLNARLSSVQQSCSLPIPAAITIDRLPLTPNEILAGTELNVLGNLRFQQRSSFNCPNYLRNRQTYFEHLDLIPTNSTNLEEYSINAIGDTLRRNVGFLEFEQMKGGVKWQPLVNTHNPWDRRIRLNVVIHINNMEVRYWTSIGQQMFRMWIEYLAVLVVFVLAVDQFKRCVFAKIWLRTWEVLPWKQKMY